MLEALRIELKHWQETPGPDATLVVRRLKQLIREKEIEKILRGYEERGKMTYTYTYTYTETKTIKPSDIYRLRYAYKVPEGYVIVDFRPPLGHETYLPTILSGVNEAGGDYAPNEPRLILAKVYTLKEALASDKE